MTKTRMLHLELYDLANETAQRHFVQYDGEECFNLHTFLDDLESRLIARLDAIAFELDPTAAARLLWCCLTSEPAGTRFRGREILD